MAAAEQGAGGGGVVVGGGSAGVPAAEMVFQLGLKSAVILLNWIVVFVLCIQCHGVDMTLDACTEDQLLNASQVLNNTSFLWAVIMPKREWYPPSCSRRSPSAPPCQDPMTSASSWQQRDDVLGGSGCDAAVGNGSRSGGSLRANMVSRVTRNQSFWGNKIELMICDTTFHQSVCFG